MSGAPSFDPHKLDVAAFAAAHAELAGEWPLSALPRLMQDAVPSAGGSGGGQLRWSAQGARRAVAGGPIEARLQLQASASLSLLCQRCLQPMTVDLAVRPSLRFVAGEALAAQLDEDSEDDVLPLGAALDLQELIEDEMILALPLVPKHEHCAPPPHQDAGAAPHAESVGHPFAGLASLRGRKDDPG